MHPVLKPGMNDATNKLDYLIDWLNRGEDYQLIFSCSPNCASQIEAIAKAQSIQISAIGSAINTAQLLVEYQDQVIQLNDDEIRAYQHF